MPPAPTRHDGPKSSVQRRPTSSSLPSAASIGDELVDRVADDAAAAEPRLHVGDGRARSRRGVCSTTVTPPTSLLWRICGEMTLTTTRVAAERPAVSAAAASRPLPTNTMRRAPAGRAPPAARGPSVSSRTSRPSRARRRRRGRWRAVSIAVMRAASRPAWSAFRFVSTTFSPLRRTVVWMKCSRVSNVHRQQVRRRADHHHVRRAGRPGLRARASRRRPGRAAAAPRTCAEHARRASGSPRC